MEDSGIGIKIRLQTCFSIPGSGSELLTLPEDVKTVGDLLLHLGKQIDYSFLDPETDNIEEDLEIIINNKAVWFYPSALDTPLKDGDRVEIYLLPLGGG